MAIWMPITRQSCLLCVDIACYTLYNITCEQYIHCTLSCCVTVVVEFRAPTDVTDDQSVMPLNHRKRKRFFAFHFLLININTHFNKRKYPNAVVGVSYVLYRLPILEILFYLITDYVIYCKIKFKKKLLSLKHTC